MNLKQSLDNYLQSRCYRNISARFPQYVKKIDHCAFRSLNSNQYQKIHNGCLSYGLTLQKDVYKFPDIQVSSNWYKSKNDLSIPRVFSSLYQGKIDEMEIYKYSRYIETLNQNHYVAWTMLFPYQINHIGFSVDHIKDVYMDLKKNDVALNGDIQISNDGDLLQFSIKADIVDHTFVEGIKGVYGPFVEFIERKNGREGFYDKNARKIFDSTKKI